MENQNPRVPPLWEHSLTTILGHDPTSDPGIALEIKTVPAQQVYSLDDHGQGLYLRTNQIKQMHGLIPI